MKTKILSAFISLGCFIQPLFAQDAATNTAPVIPEAAREHFVMGTTLYSNATSVVDFKQAADEFQQAADLAPQWSKPRYNLAWAKEAAEDYAGAIADLKRYQQFNLPEAEARAVQDKIYVIKAKLAKAEKKKAEEQKVVDAEQVEKTKREAAMNAFVGEWVQSANKRCYMKIWRNSNGGLKIEMGSPVASRIASDVKLIGKALYFKMDTPCKLELANNGCLLYKSSGWEDGRHLEESQGIEYCGK